MLFKSDLMGLSGLKICYSLRTYDLFVIAMPSSYIVRFCEQLSRHFYSVIWLLSLPFLLVKWGLNFVKFDKHVAAEYLSRFGCTQKTLQKNAYLLHCASVGEVVAAQQIIEHLLQRYPNTAVTITTNTMTGRQRVAELFGERVTHCYLPYDFPVFVRRFLANIQPKMLLVTEMELWPNLCHHCWKNGIPVYIINGRMSEKSTASYQKLSWLMRPLFSKLSGVCAQGLRDYNNYLRLGLTPERLTLSHNIKFDILISEAELARAEQLALQLECKGRTLLVAGSTHEPEEQVLVEAYLKLRGLFPDLLLVIVPRHPQRFEQVYALLRRQNLQVVRTSQMQACNEATQVVLADQMGILRPLYALATCAFVGGSIAQRGGHNALEPAALGVPVMMGRSIFNNPQICHELQQAGALQFVDDAGQIVEYCTALLREPELLAKAAQAAQTVITQNRGAVARTLTFLGL